LSDLSDSKIKDDIDLEILSDEDTKTGNNKTENHREDLYKDGGHTYQIVPNKVMEPAVATRISPMIEIRQVEPVVPPVVSTVVSPVVAVKPEIGLNDEFYDEKIESNIE
jgi:hypothetical protein